MERIWAPFLKTRRDDVARKPLVVRGARQTGKTWLIQNVGQQLWGDVVYLNFERDPSLAQGFASNDPRATVAVLEALLKRPITAGKNLLFLDEIQAAPQVLAKLRWFHEELPELHVVAAGSLLDFALASPAFSMPVGRISYGHVEPMTFAEFLLACGEERLLTFVRAAGWAEPVPAPIHDQLMNLVRVYSFVGGMPAAVAAWVATRSYEAVADLQRDLLQTIRDDFNKYESALSSRVSRLRVAKVFAALPQLVGRKFMPSEVDRDEKSLNLKDAFRLLSLARVVTPVHRTSANGIPLGAQVDERYQKVCFLDVGLYTNMTGVDAANIRTRDDLTLINNGQLAEQLVGQELRACRPFNQEPQLFTWARETKNSNAEVDYVLQVSDKVVPVEVKAGATGRLRSLQMMVQEKALSLAVRVNSQPMQRSELETALPIGPSRKFTLLSVPFYMVSELPRLLAAEAR
ncbi:MAG: AAA family ATPase [Deltaproteobacteria bacterium]|nr:AAA family ATPase [Deltaproteobacteria bacterium]